MSGRKYAGDMHDPLLGITMQQGRVCHPQYLSPLLQVRYLLGKASFKISFIVVLTFPNNTPFERDTVKEHWTQN